LLGFGSCECFGLLLLPFHRHSPPYYGLDVSEELYVW
jgi:hypothetical protein